MLNITEENNTSLYYNVDDCVNFCKKIENIKLKEHVDFHMFWNVGLEFERKQLLPIKSYICTQDLEMTKLNIWSNIDLSNNEYIKPYLNYINLRIWDPIKESKDTLLEGRENILKINDKLNWLAGDLFRILCLHKYGGLYADFDTVFLRDLSPVLNQEFMYKWSFQKNMINGAVIRMYKNSKLSQDLVKELIKIQPAPGSVCWSTQLYETVRKYNKDWTIFPCGFFNTEWQIKLTDSEKSDPKNKELIKFITSPFKKTDLSNQLYDGVFMWHWHNGWKEEIENGSKWYILEEKYDKIFLEKFKINME